MGMERERERERERAFIHQLFHFRIIKVGQRESYIFLRSNSSGVTAYRG
jgi:hypothetical protein